MTQYSVFSKTAEDKNFEYSHTFYSCAPAKKEMKRLIKAGFTDVHGSKTRIWSNGDWEPAGEITLTGSNAYKMVGATRQNVERY